MNAKQRRNARRATLYRECARATGLRQTPLENRLEKPLYNGFFSKDSLYNPGTVKTVSIPHRDVPEWARPWVMDTGKHMTRIVDTSYGQSSSDYQYKAISSGGLPDSLAVRTDATDRVQRAEVQRKAILAKMG